MEYFVYCYDSQGTMIEREYVPTWAQAETLRDEWYLKYGWEVRCGITTYGA